MTVRRAARHGFRYGVRHALAPLAAIALAMSASAALSQGFPAPLPGQPAPAAGASPFPPVNGAAPSVSLGSASPFPSAGAPPVSGAPAMSGAPMSAPQAGGEAAANDCEKGFLPLRNDAEKRGQAIKAASERRAPPDEACKLIGAFSTAEIKMIRFVETHAQKCGIPPQVADQLKSGHKNTDTMMKKVCTVAQQMQQRGPAGPSLSEVLGSPGAAPEATAARRKGGSAFDTLNGNVLTR